MIRSRIVLSEELLILELKISGHAIKQGKASVPCASVSVLTGTFARLLEQERGIEIEGGAERPGSLILKVLRVEPGMREFYRGLCSFLLKGLQETSLEFPGEVEVELLTRAEKLNI